MSNTNIFLIGALEVLVEMKKQGIPFNKETYLLAVAICYKLVSIMNEKVFEMLSLSLPFFWILNFGFCLGFHIFLVMILYLVQVL